MTRVKKHFYEVLDFILIKSGRNFYGDKKQFRLIYQSKTVETYRHNFLQISNQLNAFNPNGHALPLTQLLCPYLMIS